MSFLVTSHESKTTRNSFTRDSICIESKFFCNNCVFFFFKFFEVRRESQRGAAVLSSRTDATRRDVAINKDVPPRVVYYPSRYSCNVQIILLHVT